MTDQPLTHAEVVACMKENQSSFRKIITRLATTYDPDTDCSCHHAGQAFGGFHL